MRKYAFVVAALVLGLAWLPACRFSGLRLPFAPASSLRDLLEYIPPGLADYHPADLHGPAIHLADLERIRRELRLPRVTGTGELEARRSAISKLPVQRFELLPREIAAPAFAAYEEWGWDLNDVNQVLCVPDLDLAVLLGDFARPAIRERLAEEGYSGAAAADFTLFTSPSHALIFALSDDALLVGTDAKWVRVLADQEAQPESSLADHPSVVALLPYLDGAWAAWLATSGDLEAMYREAGERLPREVVESLLAEYGGPGEEAWDLVAVLLRGPQKEPELSILYHYPSEEEARRDLPLVATSLKEAPSMHYRNLTWGDLVTAESIGVDDSVVVAQVTMADPWNMYAAIRDRDLSWLPIRQKPGSD